MAKSRQSSSESDGNEAETQELSKVDENMDNQEAHSSIDVVSKSFKVSTPISILIESLVKNLCTLCESDSKKAEATYNMICNKLFKMDMIDESYNMIEFEGMRAEYQKAFFHLLKTSTNLDHLALRPVWPNDDCVNSHYCKEFDEIDYIAKGGFGQVFKVKHKLDGTEYAIKKIPIRSEGIQSVRNYLSEVKTFASMNHSNIVQYKAAWIELGAPSTNDNVTESDTDSYSYTSLKNAKVEIKEHIDNEYIYYQSALDSFSDHKKDDSSDFEVSFEHTISNITNHFNDEYTGTGYSLKKSKRVKRDSLSEGDMAICKLDKKEIRELRIQQRGQIKWATLYIQMALCQSTLKHWLENRNNVESNRALIPVKGHVRSDTILEVLRQLLKGLEYMHSKDAVHHDIKPSNIFIEIENGNLLVQLGDFGLACPLQSVRHSLAFGTKLYAAPEQLAGKCDPKSDMYSVGIVLFELVETFRTDMERTHCITELRKGNLPTHLLAQDSQFSQIISKLVSKNPEDRPSANKLLESITQHSTNNESQKIEELQCQIAKQDAEIIRLKNLLKSAGLKE